MVKLEIDAKLLEAYREKTREAERIWVQRQGQYGLTPWWEKPEVLTALMRVKMWRLEQSEDKKSRTDSLYDIINYAVIALMVERGEWR